MVPTADRSNLNRATGSYCRGMHKARWSAKGLVLLGRSAAFIAIIGFMIASRVSLAQSGAGVRRPPCTPAEFSRAEEEGDKLRTWHAVHVYYQHYGKCEDADAAEGVSDSVARLLANHWDTLPELAGLVNQDGTFLDFVLGGLNATDDTKDLDAIRMKSAPSKCPVGLSRICLRIHKQAISALKNDER